MPPLVVTATRLTAVLPGFQARLTALKRATTFCWAAASSIASSPVRMSTHVAVPGTSRSGTRPFPSIQLSPNRSAKQWAMIGPDATGSDAASLNPSARRVFSTSTMTGLPANVSRATGSSASTFGQ